MIVFTKHVRSILNVDTVDDRDNLEYMFKPYKTLGGNGTGEELYNRCLALPYESDKKEE